MFKFFLRGVKKIVNKGFEMGEKIVDNVENKVNSFVNGTYEELDNLGNCLAIIGPFLGVGVGLIGVGIKVFANTKR